LNGLTVNQTWFRQVFLLLWLLLTLHWNVKRVSLFSGFKIYSFPEIWMYLNDMLQLPMRHISVCHTGHRSCDAGGGTMYTIRASGGMGA
jgi:hypothetical protein